MSVVFVPAAKTSGAEVTLDVTDFDKKLGATDNLVQELADKFDEHTHAYSEITDNTHSHAYADITDNTHSHGMSELTDFIAPNDAGTDLGAVDKRWKDIYASNAVIQTSDETVKTDVKHIDYLEAWDFLAQVNPVTFRFTDGKRTHYGFIAQQVRDSLGDKDRAVYCESDTGFAGLRYDEMIAPIVRVLQSAVDTADAACSDLVAFRKSVLVDTDHLTSSLNDVEADVRDYARVVSGLNERIYAVSEQLTKDFVALASAVQAPTPIYTPSKLPMILSATAIILSIVAMAMHLA